MGRWKSAWRNIPLALNETAPLDHSSFDQMKSFLTASVLLLSVLALRAGDAPAPSLRETVNSLDAPQVTAQYIDGQPVATASTGVTVSVPLGLRRTVLRLPAKDLPAAREILLKARWSVP